MEKIKVFDGWNYWDTDVTTGEPIKVGVLDAPFPLSYFDLKVAGEPIVVKSDVLFSVPTQEYNLTNRIYKFPNQSRDGEVKTNTVINTDWATPRPKDLVISNTQTSSIDTTLVTEFFIKYHNKTNKTYKFAIAPSTESYVGGPNQSPEVKSGILTRSSNAIKSFTLSGGEPVYQMLGIEPTLLYLTGLFIGAETSSESGASTNNLTTNIYNTKASLNAVSAAELFDQEVTKSGRTIQLHLYSKNNGTDKDITIKYVCIIQNARYFMRRSDRVYYALDLFILRRL